MMPAKGGGGVVMARPLWDDPETLAQAILSVPAMRARIEAAIRAEEAAIRHGEVEPLADDVWADIDPDVAAVIGRIVARPVGGRPPGSKSRRPMARQVGLV